MSKVDNRPLNLEDIATLAGVSRSTASRVINNDKYVSERTRARVTAVIEAYNFTPNPGGRMLMTQRTQAIGVVFMLSPDDLFEDPYYFPMLLQGINEATSARDYTTLFWLGSEAQETAFQQRLLQNRLMDGLIIASIGSGDPLLDKLLAKKTPFVMVERPAERAAEISFVTVDNVAAAQAAVGHLISLGCQSVGTVTGKLDHVDGQDRLEGYRKALLEAGLPFDPALVATGDFSYQSGYEGARQLFSKGVDALFTATDRAALGALQAFEELGVHVPEEVAVIGFDDLPDPLVKQAQLSSVQHYVSKRRLLGE